MNGAESLLKTLVDSGVEVCFANPGTSEMQLVAAIGESDDLRPVLCLFEGGVSGAADGYARMTGKPAATLLHLGAGLSNSLANLHNARRAGSPVVNIVGDHASYHLQFDAPLTSNLAGLARWGSHWTKVAQSPEDLSLAGAEAVQASLRGNGQIATLIAQADHAWSESSTTAEALPPAPAMAVSEERVSRIAAAIRSTDKRTCLFLGGQALLAENLNLLGAVAKKYGLTLMCSTFPARLQRGEGRVSIQRLPYFAEQAEEVLEKFDQLILVGAPAPVSFFAYPDKESWLTPEHCELHMLAESTEEISTAVTALVEQLSVKRGIEDKTARHNHPLRDKNAALTPRLIGQVMNNTLPANAIVSDEGATASLHIFAATAGAAAHDWLALTGGAIGQGLPLALGAAVACPERKVIALEADGSSMYTIQTLWSMARENADVTVVLLNNRSYAILNIELARVGAGKATAKTQTMLDLSNPDLDFVQIAQGHGVSATRANTVSEFDSQFADAMATPGPHLIECMLTNK